MVSKSINFNDYSNYDFTNLDSSKSSIQEANEDFVDSDSDENSSSNKIKISKLLQKQKTLKKPKKVQIIYNVSDTQYDVVRFVGKKIFKWKLSYQLNSLNWDVMWTDNAIQPENLARMSSHQKINHFPGMYNLHRKNHLGKNLMRMKKAFPEHYKFFPQTFLLPSEYNEFKNQFTDKKKTFIVKPEFSCQGKGIFLTRSWESIQPGEHYVIQRYLRNPYLIDGLKFDMRIYVLVAGVDPLKIFLFDDGLARFCTEKFVAPGPGNLDNMFMHLTNYAINKESANFVFNEDSGTDNVGHKRSLKAVFRILEEQGHDTKKLWKEIKKIIIKTFCSVQPVLAQTYRSCQPDEPFNNMCFELLGFDVILDSDLNPLLLEVNHTPSFTTDTPLDKSIKMNAIRDALRIMNISVEDKIKAKNKKKAEFQRRVLTGKKPKLSTEEKQAAFESAQKIRDEWEAANCGRYTKIYPFDDPSEAEEDYEMFMRTANKLLQEWTGLSVKRNVKQLDSPKPPPMIFGQNSPNNNNSGRGKETKPTSLRKLKSIDSAALASPKISSQNSLGSNKFRLTSTFAPKNQASLIEIPKDDEVQEAQEVHEVARRQSTHEIRNDKQEDFVVDANEVMRNSQEFMTQASYQLRQITDIKPRMTKTISRTIKATVKQQQQPEKNVVEERQKETPVPEFNHFDQFQSLENSDLRRSEFEFNFERKSPARKVSPKAKTLTGFYAFEKNPYSNNYIDEIKIPEHMTQSGNKFYSPKFYESELDLTKSKSPKSLGTLIERGFGYKDRLADGKRVSIQMPGDIFGPSERSNEPQSIQRGDAHVKSITNLSRRVKKVNELKGITVVKRNSPSSLHSPHKFFGNFVSPKVFEMNLNSGTRLLQSGSLKTRPSNQKILSSSSQFSLEQNATLQRLLNFLQNKDAPK